jgi:F-type H+-transporting ATPase subunit delta
VNPAVQGYAAAVIGDVADDQLGTVAADLVAVEHLFAHNAGLASAMTDVAVPARARRAVLDDLLEDKVSPRARRMAAFAAGAVHAQEVPAAIAWVAVRTRQAAEGREPTEPVLGHREARERVGGYAAEVYEDLSVRELEEVEDELFRFARTVATSPDLRDALGDRDLPASVRKGVVDDLLRGRAHTSTVRLVGYAVTGGRPRDIVGTLDWLVEQTAMARGWRVARVRAGQEVDAEERRELEEALSRLAGSPVELQVTVDPRLLAGVNVEIGDLRLDATARGRLERLREHMVSGGWGDQGFGRLERRAQGLGGESGGGGAG